MMTRAYQEMYVSKAQATLGDVFDYAINVCGISGSDFVKLFVASAISKRMQNGEPACIVGKSGIEIVQEIIKETKNQEMEIKPHECFGRSCEYWIGWAVAYYQWYSDRKYCDIFEVLSFQMLQKMYYTLHEADITKFVDIVDRKIRDYFSDTNLKRFRMTNGFSQAQLAERSDVSINLIQMYEQRTQDINKASADTIYKLAKALGCSMEALIEI